MLPFLAVWSQSFLWTTAQLFAESDQSRYVMKYRHCDGKLVLKVTDNLEVTICVLLSLVTLVRRAVLSLPFLGFRISEGFVPLFSHFVVRLPFPFFFLIPNAN